MNRITVRLSRVIEERMRTIISDYKMAMKSCEKVQDSSTNHNRQLSPEPPIPSRWVPSMRRECIPAGSVNLTLLKILRSCDHVIWT